MCLCVVARGKSGRAGGGGAPARRRYHETEGVHLKVQRFSGQRTGTHSRLGSADETGVAGADTTNCAYAKTPFLFSSFPHMRF